MTAASDCAAQMADEAAQVARNPGFAAERARLARSGRFEETFEWRIGTEMTRGIERKRDGYRVWARTEGSWEAFVATEDEALEAHYVLSRLQQSLFYAIGWASWASKTQIDETDPARLWTPSARNACERYLTQLWSEGRERARSISVEAAIPIEHGDAWEHGVSRLRPSPDQHMWVEAQTSVPGLKFVSASPTVDRAAEFLLVYEGLANDIPREFGWPRPEGSKVEERP
jgi:hypothetical protein